MTDCSSTLLRNGVIAGHAWNYVRFALELPSSVSVSKYFFSSSLAPQGIKRGSEEGIKICRQVMKDGIPPLLTTDVMFNQVPDDVHGMMVRISVKPTDSGQLFCLLVTR